MIFECEQALDATDFERTMNWLKNQEPPPPYHVSGKQFGEGCGTAIHPLIPLAVKHLLLASRPSKMPEKCRPIRMPHRESAMA